MDGQTDDMELLATVIQWKNLKFICCVVYLPPNYKEEQYLQVLNCLENIICIYSDLNVLILGDFNLNSCSAIVKTQFRSFLEFGNLYQHNNIANEHGGILDLVLSGLGPQSVSVTGEVEALVPPDAYHPPLEATIALRRGKYEHLPSPPQPESVRVNPAWNFRRVDFGALYSAIENIDWSDVLSIQCVDSAAEMFYAKLNECFSYYVPLKKQLSANKRYAYPSWYTPEIIRNIRDKYFHFKKYKQAGLDFNQEMYRYYRGRVKFLIDRAYRHYLRKLEQDITDDPARFWDYVKSKRKDRKQFSEFTYKGEKVSGQSAANAFADYFSSVFQCEQPQLDVEEAMQGVNGAEFQAALVSVDNMDSADLRRAAKRLKSRSSAGLDDIPPYIAKDCISALEDPLLHIYNLALKCAVYPARWKKSRVTPVPKSGLGTEVETYRPIAVLSVFGKLFEMMIDYRITHQFSTQLADGQHGFRRGRSTSTNLTVFVDYASVEMDAGRQIDAAYFDFRKAFDLVDNDILLQKCACVGFSPGLLRFFASYLKDRCQVVRISGCESKPFHTRSGVSQGSTLGPKLFILMINDLPKVVSTAKCLLFADDLKLFLGVSEISDCEVLQRDIDAVAEWSELNKLHFNISKCKTITFSRIRKPISALYTLHGVPLERVTEIRDLGLTFDRELSLRQHVTTVCRESSKTLGFIMRMSYQFPSANIALMLYNAYVRSKLEYGAVVWDPHEVKYTMNVEKI